MLKLHKLFFCDVGTHSFSKELITYVLIPVLLFLSLGKKGIWETRVTTSIIAKHVLGCLFLLQKQKEGLFCHMGGVERQVWSNMLSCIYACSWSDALLRKAQGAAAEAEELSCLYSWQRLLSMAPVLLCFKHTGKFLTSHRSIGFKIMWQSKHGCFQPVGHYFFCLPQAKKNINGTRLIFRLKCCRGMRSGTPYIWSCRSDPLVKARCAPLRVHLRAGGSTCFSSWGWWVQNSTSCRVKSAAEGFMAHF